jgi:putative hydrolase of the HAD superfamily
MIKAIFLIWMSRFHWNQKRIKEAFAATCELAKDRYGIVSVLCQESDREVAQKLYFSYDTTKMIHIMKMLILHKIFYIEDC